MELNDIKGIGTAYEKKLFKAGIADVDMLVLADLQALSKKTGISILRLQQWQKIARKKVQYKQTEVREDISKVSSVIVTNGTATVFIRDVSHENVPVFKGSFDQLKKEMENKRLAVYLDQKDKVTLWFNRHWHNNIPIRDALMAQPSQTPVLSKKEPQKGFLSKLKEWWHK